MEDKKKDEEQFEFNRVLELNQRLKNLKEMELLNKRIKFSAYIVTLLASIVPILTVTKSFLFKETSQNIILSPDKLIIILSISSLSLALIRLKDRNLVVDRIKETSDELEYLNIEDESDIKKAEKQFKLHQNELQKYYSQNLSHSQKIFYTGIVCIILGFGIIAFTMWILSTKNINNTLELMITGGIGGVLSNFIGVIYLKMYSETLKVLIEFHNKLVYTHNLHFSNYLLAKVENKELKEKILQEAILAIVKKEKLD